MASNLLHFNWWNCIFYPLNDRDDSVTLLHAHSFDLRWWVDDGKRRRLVHLYHERNARAQELKEEMKKATSDPSVKLITCKRDESIRQWPLISHERYCFSGNGAPMVASCLLDLIMCHLFNKGFKGEFLDSIVGKVLHDAKVTGISPIKVFACNNKHLLQVSNVQSRIKWHMWGPFNPSAKSNSGAITSTIYAYTLSPLWPLNHLLPPPPPHRSIWKRWIVTKKKGKNSSKFYFTPCIQLIVVIMWPFEVSETWREKLVCTWFVQIDGEIKVSIHHWQRMRLVQGNKEIERQTLRWCAIRCLLERDLSSLVSPLAKQTLQLTNKWSQFKWMESWKWSTKSRVSRELMRWLE